MGGPCLRILVGQLSRGCIVERWELAIISIAVLRRALTCNGSVGRSNESFQHATASLRASRINGLPRNQPTGPYPAPNGKTTKSG